MRVEIVIFECDKSVAFAGELVAEMLIKSGADANSARDDGETAVHMSARKGNLKTFKLLLEEGGDARTQSEVRGRCKGLEKEKLANLHSCYFPLLSETASMLLSSQQKNKHQKFAVGNDESNQYSKCLCRARINIA